MYTMKTKLVLTLCSLIAIFQANAQQISEKMLKSCPPTVALKVYDIASKIMLSEEKQLALAKMFQDQDSMVIAAMTGGIKSSEIPNLRAQSENYLSNILSAKELKALNTAKEKELSASRLVYLDKRIAELDSIKPVEISKKNMIRNIYLNLCNRPGIQNQVDNFNEALQFSLRDTSYYAALNRTQIKEKASKKASSKVALLLKEKKIGKGSASKFYSLQYAKEKELATLDLIYPYQNPEKSKLQDAIIAKYDSLVNPLIEFDPNNLPPTSFFSEVIKSKKYLKLNQSQIDSLAKKGYELDKVRRAHNEKSGFNRFNTTEYELTNIRKFLNEDQFNKFLILKNTPKAKQMAQKDWQEMKLRKLTNGNDSATTVNQLINYELAKLVAKEQYANDLIRQEENLKAIKQSEPVLLKKMYMARKSGIHPDFTSTRKSTDNVQW